MTGFPATMDTTLEPPAAGSMAFESFSTCVAAYEPFFMSADAAEQRNFHARWTFSKVTLMSTLGMSAFLGLAARL